MPLPARMTQAVLVDLADLEDLGAPADTAVREGPIIPVGPVARVDPAVPDPITPADLADRVDPAARVPITRADPADQGAPVVREGRVARGTAMISEATSTAPRGARVLGRGARAHHRGRRGTDRSPRPAVNGVMVRSTTGATRKPRTGTPVSTSGALTSSGSGFRCKDR